MKVPGDFPLRSVPFAQRDRNGSRLPHILWKTVQTSWNPVHDGYLLWWNTLHNVHCQSFHYIQKTDLIAFFVCTNGSYSEISRECFLRDRNNISSSLLIHFPAYVDSRAVFVESNVEMAFINPMVPMEIRSSSSTSVP